MLLRIAVLVCCSVSAGCGWMGSWSPLLPLERAAVYQPPARESAQQLGVDPRFEDAWFDSNGATTSMRAGRKLHGIYRHHEQPRAVVLYCHGNAEDVADLKDELETLHQRHQVSIMAFDYGGYGRSEGKPSETTILQDARAARHWLAKRAGISEHGIVLMGRSLGGGVAVDLAASDSPRALVLVSTFTSLPDVGKHHLKSVPTHWLMTQRLDSLSKIGRYQGPLLQSHGDADEVIPYAMGQTLFAAAGESLGPRQFLTNVNGRHNDRLTPEFHEAFDKFLESLRQWENS